jgi:hypothetical protein
MLRRPPSDRGSDTGHGAADREPWTTGSRLARISQSHSYGLVLVLIIATFVIFRSVGGGTHPRSCSQRQSFAAQSSEDAQGDLNAEWRSQAQPATPQFEWQVESTVQALGSSTPLSGAATQLQSAVKQLANGYKQSLARGDCG